MARVTYGLRRTGGRFSPTGRRAAGGGASCGVPGACSPVIPSRLQQIYTVPSPAAASGGRT